MSQILNMSQHTTDEELHSAHHDAALSPRRALWRTVQFKLEDAQRVRTSLATKMVQMQVGDEVRLRIIDRLPELR
jgi:hypothetical protein